MSRSMLHDWECAIERICGDKANEMLEIARDIYNTAYVRGGNAKELIDYADYRQVQIQGGNMTRKEFLGAYNIGHRDGKEGDYLPNDYDDIFHIEQEPCEDCISREEVIDTFKHWYSELLLNNEETDFCDIVRALPSVQPKTGHWIRFKEFENGYYHIKCSVCGQYWSVDGHAKIFRYCFNCGAKMSESEDEE